MCEIILAGIKFGDFPQNHQFAKLKTLPKFPTIRYINLIMVRTKNNVSITALLYIPSGTLVGISPGMMSSYEMMTFGGMR